VAFGPVATRRGGTAWAVVEAPDEQGIRILAESSPVISTGLFTYEVFTMSRAQYLQTGSRRYASQPIAGLAHRAGHRVRRAGAAQHRRDGHRRPAGKLSLVRLIGATRRQARRMIAWEALGTTPCRPGRRRPDRARRRADPTRTTRLAHHRPSPALSGEILGGAALLGLAGTLVRARLALRARPMAAFGRGEYAGNQQEGALP
jgi:hypothetical protein